MNVLIVHCVPLNGGDEALLRALMGGLKRRFGGASGKEISVRCLVKDLPKCQSVLPDVEMYSDLEFSDHPTRLTPLEQFELSDLSKCSEAVRKTMEHYQWADVVLSAPGGFLHDHYAIEHRLRSLEWAAGLGKPVILAGQSVGPFWFDESKRRIRQVLPKLAAVCLRDEISLKHLQEAEVSTQNVVMSADVAFLLTHDLGLKDLGKKARTNRLAVGLRAWPIKDEASKREIIAKGTALVVHLLKADESRTIGLISTCQGVEGYHDDSALSAAVLENIGQSGDSKLTGRITLDRKRRGPVDFTQELGGYDGYVSMRLHGCIMAMLGGTPAFGLAYESKTPEIFGQMGLEADQIPFTASAAEWIAGVEGFLHRLSERTEQLPQKLEEISKKSLLTIETIATCLHPQQHRCSRLPAVTPLVA